MESRLFAVGWFLWLLLILGNACPGEEQTERDARRFLNKKGAYIESIYPEGDDAGDMPLGEDVCLDGKDFGDDDLKYLASIPNIRVLSLRESRVTDDGLRHLAALKGLRMLYIDSTNTSESGFQHLTALKDLTSLCLQNTLLTSKGVAQLNGFPNLEYLDISDNFRVSVIKINGGLPSLKAITARKCPVQEVRVADLPKLAKLEIDHEYLDIIELTNLRALTSLAVGWGEKGHPVSEKGHLTFEPRPQRFIVKDLHNLEELHLGWGEIPAEDLSPLSSFSRLRDLEVHHTREGGFVKHLAGMRQLERLDLTGAPISNDEAVFLDKLTNLRCLKLARCKLNGRILTHMRGLTKLEELDLSDIGPITLEDSRTLGNLTELRSLTLDSCDAKGEILQSVAGLKKLQHLCLYNNRGVCDAHLQHLAMLDDLQSLDVSKCGLSGPGLAHLAGLKNLRELEVDGNPLTADAIKHLSKLKGLREIRLCGTPFNSDWVDEMAELSFLKTLWIAGGSLKESELDQLQKEMPNTKIRQFR